MEVLKQFFQRKDWFIHVGFILLIIGIILYNLPYFKEMREYSKVESAYKSNSFDNVNNAAMRYFSRFPKGRHVSEVLYMPVKLGKKSDIINLLNATENYLEKDPNGPYVTECKEITDSIWDKEISKYEYKAEQFATKKGADFIIAMLYIMKSRQTRVIDIEALPILALKEYSEYPMDVRMFVESGQDTDFPIQIPKDIKTIKDQVSIEKARSWINFVVSSLQKGFNGVFTPNFITFRFGTVNKESNNNLNPIVKVEYTVSTNEIAFEELKEIYPELQLIDYNGSIPDIWIHSNESENGEEIPVCYLLGIGMNFDAQFSIPDSNVTYNITEKGDPGTETIKGDFDQGYAKMCERATEKFAWKIIDEFGLQESE